MKQNISHDKLQSGGRKIEDHAFWAGPKGKNTVFPDGPHKTKEEHSAEGSAAVMKYEDTTEAIHEYQQKADNKVRKHPRVDGNRN
jgi:hypothetical protein